MRRAVQAVFVVAIAGSGCSREHLAPAFGRAHREAMAMQQVTLAKPPPPPNMRLDTQESEVIAESYVRNLSGKSKAEPEPVLYVSPQRPGTQQLAPSVPRQ